MVFAREFNFDLICAFYFMESMLRFDKMAQVAAINDHHVLIIFGRDPNDLLDSLKCMKFHTLPRK